MKRNKIIIIAVLFATMLTSRAVPVSSTPVGDQEMAQAAPTDTNPPAVTTPVEPAAPEPSVSVGPINLDPFFSATNLSIAISPAYAPHLRESDGVLDHYGATLAILYPVTPVSGNLFAGYRFDYIGGGFTASTVSATYQVPIVLWNKIHVQPFATAGVNLEMSGGRGGALGVVAGAGALVTIHNFGSAGILSAFFEDEVWSIFNNAQVEHLGLIYSIQL